MSTFERYLTLWVALCIAAGVALGKAAPAAVDALRLVEFGAGSHINAPIAALLWLMIYPMMLKVDFAAVLGVGRRPKGLLVTLVVNWLVKPFSMAFLGWAFFKGAFLPLIGPDLAEQYLKKAAAYVGTDSDIHSHLAELFLKQGRYDEARSAWTKSLQFAEDTEEAQKIRKKLDDIRGKTDRK